MIDLTEILARGEVATPGPWHEKHSMVWPSSAMFADDQVADCSCSNREQANLDFIVHSRRDLPACAALLRRVCLALGLDPAAVDGEEMVAEIEDLITELKQFDDWPQDLAELCELDLARQRIEELEGWKMRSIPILREIWRNFTSENDESVWLSTLGEIGGLLDEAAQPRGEGKGG